MLLHEYKHPWLFWDVLNNFYFFKPFNRSGPVALLILKNQSWSRSQKNVPAHFYSFMTIYSLRILTARKDTTWIEHPWIFWDVLNNLYYFMRFNRSGPVALLILKNKSWSKSQKNVPADLYIYIYIYKYINR